MDTCKLCLNPAKLCRSHIIPEFCYRPLYDTLGRAVVVNPQDPSDWGYAQQGTRSYLLCQDCEGLLNDRYEKPFKVYWYDGDVLAPFRAGATIQILTGIDYSSFKLFHLSLLFRASVSDHPIYHEVDLGPHEDRIRQMLLDQDPGEEWQYPINCSAVDDTDGGVWEKVVGLARKIRHDGHWGYYFTFAGCQWTYLVSSHPSKVLTADLCLTKQGRLPVVKMPWKDVEHPDHDWLRR